MPKSKSTHTPKPHPKRPPAGPGGPPSPGLGPAPEGRQFGEPNRSPDEVSFVTNVNDKHYYIT